MLTPFSLTALTTTRLLHEIDLHTYAGLLAEGRDLTFFFQELTNWLAGQGQQVVHLWEDVARQKPTVVASRLAALRGESVRVPGRLTQVRRIDKVTAMTFLADNHLQVALPGKVRYGLFLPQRYYRVLPAEYADKVTDEELLLAVATYAQPRHRQQEAGLHRSAELLRFANRLGYTVVGGLDKLLTAYLRNHPADDLMTYADRDWSDGASYQKLGFDFVSDTSPQQFWLHPAAGIRHTAMTLPDGVSLTNARLLGYLPVFNAGSRKFVKTV